MRRCLFFYVPTLVVFLAMDAVWLTLTATPLYRATIGDIMAGTPRPAPAILFYLLYVAGIVIFVIPTAVRTGRAGSALPYGALFGLIAYATYDLTNFATLRGWSLQLTILDMVWGMVVTGTASAIGYSAGRTLLRLTGAASP